MGDQKAFQEALKKLHVNRFKCNAALVLLELMPGAIGEAAYVAFRMELGDNFGEAIRNLLKQYEDPNFNVVDPETWLPETRPRDQDEHNTSWPEA